MWRRTRATQVGHGARGSLYLYVSHWDLGSFVSVAYLDYSPLLLQTLRSGERVDEAPSVKIVGSISGEGSGVS